MATLTLSALLEQGCQKVMGRPPEKKSYEAGDGKHGSIITVERWRGEGTSRNRKTAQHMAARQVLVQIVEAGRYREYLIPGSTKTEAMEYVKNLQPELGVDEALARENWPGRCDELCTQRKLPRRPEYAFEDIVEGNDHRFICTASLLRLSAKGEGSSKKKAKAAAARSLFTQIESQLKAETLRVVEIQQAAIEKSAAGLHDEEPAAEHVFDPTGNFDDWLKKELDGRDLKKHSTHDCCPGSEAMFHRIVHRAASEQKHFIERLWPQFEYKFFLDITNVLQLTDNGSDTDYIQKQYDGYKRFDTTSVSVFIDVSSEGRLRNIFAGTGNTVKNARELACCSALNYIKNCIESSAITTK